MEMPDFESYLKRKHIDPDSFRKNEPDRWTEYNHIFKQVHPESFTAMKLFKINGIRRKYPYNDEREIVKSAPSSSVKPKIPVKPKIK